MEKLANIMLMMEKLYGYTSDLPKRLLAFPLFLQLKKQE